MSGDARMRAGLDQLNRAPSDEARTALARCCGAAAWVEAMLRRRPFRDRDDLLEQAREVWQHLDPAHWRESFEHHPRIGALDANSPPTAAWAAAEQAGATAASDPIKAALARANRDYEERFGFRFIVCATGLGAEELLARLEGRIAHAPDRELAVASEEHMKITRLRLMNLLEETP